MNCKEEIIKTLFIIFFPFFLLLLIGCYSVPHAKGYSADGETYIVTVDRDYMQRQEEFKYAINSFVEEQGAESYDIKRNERSNSFTITVPGSTPVEDLPKVKHFHKGRTMAAIFVPTGIVAVGTPLVLYFIWFFSMWNSMNSSMDNDRDRTIYRYNGGIF